MDKEEKEVKKTPKKTATTTKTATSKQTTVKKSEAAKKEKVKKVETIEAKKEEVKPTVKEEKKVPVKKTTVKKTTVKPAVKKENVEAKEVKKEEVKPTVKEEKKVPVKKTTVKKTTVKPAVKNGEVENKEVKVEIKEQKVVTSATPKNKISKELFEIRKKRYIIETIIVAVVFLVALLFLCNETFLKTSYKAGGVNVSIPRFSYFVSDKVNTVKLLTLRKSDYLKEYYNEYLEGFIFYSCAEGNNTFYYNEETKTLIKEITVEKKFAIKTIKITYDRRTPEEVCGLR